MPLPSGSPIADNDDALARDYWRVAERYAGAVVARQPDLEDFRSASRSAHNLPKAASACSRPRAAISTAG
jgi:hypothetical protein